MRGLVERALRMLRASPTAKNPSIFTGQVDPRDFQPALVYPAGFDHHQLLDALVAVSIGNSAHGELRAYAEGDFERFLRTLDLFPVDASGRLLEVGANPYFTTLLLRRFRPGLELSLVNYFGAGALSGEQRLVFPGFDGVEETIDLPFDNVNVEMEPLPYPDASFDHVIFCEVLEHMTNDPMTALMELKRVLKPGGVMVLTTPNAARLENVVAFIEGRNMYDQYSGYGPYGRHNREYTRHELHMLMEHCGFDVEVSYSANVHPDVPPQVVNPLSIGQILGQVSNRQHDLGQYFFTRWRNSRAAKQGYPRWLYRSHPEHLMEV